MPCDPYQQAATFKAKGSCLVGRTTITETLRVHIQHGTSVVLLGPSGIGKTTILQALVQPPHPDRTGRRIIYCQEASTLRVTLRGLAEQLLSSDHQLAAGRILPSLAGCSIARLRHIVEGRLRRGRVVALLDHIGMVRGAFAGFLEEITERWSTPVVVAARSLDPADTGRLWWAAWPFAKVEVHPLTSREAERLAQRCLEEADVHLPDQADFIRRLNRVANGNPRLITQLCDMARSPQYQVGGRTDLRLLLLDLKMQDLQQDIERTSSHSS